MNITILWNTIIWMIVLSTILGIVYLSRKTYTKYKEGRSKQYQTGNNSNIDNNRLKND
ncbi:hypothetical protein ACYATM_04605 [Lactobacillaceae bacterium Scapto_B20]